MQQTGAVSCAADRRIELSSNLKRQLRETSSSTDASPRSDVACRRITPHLRKCILASFAMGGVAAAEEFAGAKLGDAELAGQCVAAASLADIGRAGSSDARDWRLARKQGAKAVAKAVAVRNAAGYAPASLEVFEMYQRMLPEDERLQGRTTRGRRLWTQRFCKQWKFVRRRIGLHQVELTLAQKRAKAPCLQVFFWCFCYAFALVFRDL